MKNRHWNNERHEHKTGHVKGGYCSESEGKGGWIRLMNFIYMYKYRTLKPAEVFLRKGKG
jgi:hypothetical protein